MTPGTESRGPRAVDVVRFARSLDPAAQVAQPGRSAPHDCEAMRLVSELGRRSELLTVALDRARRQIVELEHLVRLLADSGGGERHAE